jgi:hypothetical protein
MANSQAGARVRVLRGHRRPWTRCIPGGRPRRANPAELSVEPSSTTITSHSGPLLRHSAPGQCSSMPTPLWTGISTPMNRLARLLDTTLGKLSRFWQAPCVPI